jgi:NAD(P)-dependent dehydrogenase (short-subunit alcohol dehydrogenase family)
MAASASSATGEGAAAISEEDLAACLRVLRALAPDGLTATAELRSPRLKPLRVALQPLLEDVGSRRLNGDAAERRRVEQEHKKERHRRDQRQRAFERGWADKTRMRNERLRTLEALQASDHTPRAPDGAVGLLDGAAPPLLTDATARSTVGDAAASSDGEAALDDGGGALVERGNGSVCASSAHASSGHASSNHVAAALSDVRLVHPRACYTCKVRFDTLHHFYAQLCPPCARLNWAKRTQTADLSGRIILLTGARVKIGFCAALRLLRCGATVLATTRFPVDAADRFAALPDFASWCDRLHIYGVDLRDVSAIERLCEHVKAKFGYVSDVINNACQTIRRPPRYYSHLIEAELAPLDSMPAERRRLLLAHVECFGEAGTRARALWGTSSSGVGGQIASAETALAPVAGSQWRSGSFSEEGCVPSALWSQLPEWCSPSAPTSSISLGATGEGSPENSVGAFPSGTHGANGQQLAGGSSEQKDAFPVGRRYVNGQQLSGGRHDASGEAAEAFYLGRQDVNMQQLTSGSTEGSADAFSVGTHNDSDLFPVGRHDVNGQQLAGGRQEANGEDAEAFPVGKHDVRRQQLIGGSSDSAHAFFVGRRNDSDLFPVGRHDVNGQQLTGGSPEGDVNSFPVRRRDANGQQLAGSITEDAAFPLGRHDVNGQQLDLRTTNSWLLRLHEVSTHEAAEALAINALAPFVLNARLRPLLIDAPVEHRFVVNVSAMEGKFYR